MTENPVLVSMLRVSQALRDALKPHFEIFQSDDQNVPWRSVTHILTIGEIGVPIDVLDRATNLQLIVCNSVGYDKLDLQDLTTRGIRASNAANTTSHAVATLALGLILASYRDIVRNHLYVQSGEWASRASLPLSRDIQTAKIGLVGMGNIGQKLAEFLSPINPDISYYSRSPKPVSFRYIESLSALADACDLLICTVPGGPETQNMIGSEVFNALGSGGTFVNISRASVMRQNELIDALQSGNLGWACLDVFEDEPNVPEGLRGAQNVILSPHTGSATELTRNAMNNHSIETLIKHAKTAYVISPIC